MHLEICTIDKISFTLSIPPNCPINLFKNITKHCIMDSPIDILVESKILNIILRFLEQDIRRNDNSNIVTLKDKNFFNPYTTDDIIEICKAANYLDYEFLLEVSASLIADIIRECDADEITKLFSSKEMSKERKNEIMEEFDWLPEND